MKREESITNHKVNWAEPNPRTKENYSHIMEKKPNQ